MSPLASAVVAYTLRNQSFLKHNQILLLAYSKPPLTAITLRIKPKVQLTCKVLDSLASSSIFLFLTSV